MVLSQRYRFHEVAALRALMHAAQPLRENGDVKLESKISNKLGPI